MKEIVLYDGGGTPSPRRVKMCLIEKGLSFKIKWLNLALMDQKAPSYLKLNPMGLVPTLVHDGKTIFESNVINEYIEAQSPNPPLVPSNAYDQARMRMWFAFENDFGKPFRDAAYETFAKDRLTTDRDDELIADRQQVLLEKMAQMEDRLADGRTWLCGEQFTLADIALAPRVDMFPVIRMTDLFQRFPRIGQFMERVKARPSWAASAIRPEPGESERTIAAKAA